MLATNCPGHESLLAYHIGTLPEGDAETVIDHLSGCAACRTTLRKMGDAGDSLLAKLRRPPAKDPYLAEHQCGQAQARAKAAVRGVAVSPGPHAKGGVSPTQAPQALANQQKSPAAVGGEFDPYYLWLGIPPAEQPPDHYRLLGLRPFENNPAVIESAADRQMAHLRTFQAGQRAKLSQRLLNEVAAAKLYLMKAEKKAAYDEQLRRRLAPVAPPAPPVPPAPPARQARDPAPTIVYAGARPLVTPPPAPLGPPPPPDPMLLQRLGEYKLLQKLGEGGMGAVYKARHTKLNRDVALKILPKDREGDTGAIARFEREMQACGALEHPNIVVTHDAREIHGRQFLVMELLDGLDLEQVVRRCHPLSVAEACELIRQAALGLQFAHERGLVHRDIKPSNLMLTTQRQVKILDLGLAKLRMDGRKADEMTGTNAALGTLSYMAPEQIAETRSVDIRADIYSLGCTLYKLLVGHAPFSFPPDAPKYEIMRGHMEKTPPALGKFRADVPAEVVAAVNRMLAKDPARRFQTPAEVADALAPLAATADLAALLDRAGQTPPPAEPSSPYNETQPSLPSSATQLNQIFEAIQADAVLPGHKPREEGRKRLQEGRKPYTALVRIVGGIAAILLVALALLALPNRGGDKTAAEKKPVSPPSDGLLSVKLPQDERRGAELAIDDKAQEIPPGGDPIKVPLPPGEHSLRIKRPGYWAYAWSGKIEAGKEQEVEPKWDAIPPSPPITEPADGKLSVKLAHDERQGTKLEIDGKAHDIPPGNDPIKVDLRPGDHSLRIERPGFKAYTWSGTIEAEKEYTVTPNWEAIAAPSVKPSVKTVAQLTAVYQQAIARLDAANQKYIEALRPADKLITEWRFREAADALANVQFDEPDLTTRLAARREEVKLLAALKARLREKINAELPSKEAIGRKYLGGQVTQADEQGIVATLVNGQEEKRPWAEYGETKGQKSPPKPRPLKKLLGFVIDDTKADDCVVSGLLALACREWSLAEQYFEKAQSRGAKTDPYLGPLAAALLGQARQLLDEDKPRDAGDVLVRLEENYKHIPWFANHREVIDAARRLAARKVTEGEAKEVYEKAVKFFNDDEPYDLKPLVEEIKAKKYAETDYLTDPKRKASLADFEGAIRGERLRVAKTIKADYKTIQEAIDHAPPNSRIEILDHGPYNEPIVIPPEKEGLTLRGRKGVYPILTSVGYRNISNNVIIHGKGFRLERLVIVNDQDQNSLTDCVISDAGDVSHVNRCIVNVPSRWRIWGPTNLDVTESVVLGGMSLGGGATPSIRDCIVTGRFEVWGAGGTGSGTHLENVLCPGGVFMCQSGREFALLACTVASVKIEKAWDGTTVKNSIVGWISAATPNNTIENCDVYANEPYRDLASKAEAEKKGCFSKDPQFCNDNTFPCRLETNSPCHNRGTDGGDLGFHYTRELIELWREAIRLRDKGVIKF